MLMADDERLFSCAERDTEGKGEGKLIDRQTKSKRHQVHNTDIKLSGKITCSVVGVNETSGVYFMPYLLTYLDN